MTDQEIQKARQETRGCAEVIHLNNAGSSLMPIPVSDYLYDYLKKEEMRGGYETAESEADALNNFYTATAKLLNCAPTEIAYVENATRAWDMAFYSLHLEKGDKILTTISEYGSNVIAFLHQAKRTGAEIIFVPDDEHGQTDTNAVQNLIDDHVKLIAVSHIPTGGGLVNPAEAIGKIANANNIPYLLDACQSVGHVHLDVQTIGCDMLSGTGRKYLRGPRGTGLLYIRQSMLDQLDPPFLDQFAADLISPTEYVMLPDARRFENWERYFAGKAALGVAIDYALSWDIKVTQARVFALAAYLREQLETIGLTALDQGTTKCGIVTFKVGDYGAENMKKALSKHKINVSVAEGSGNLVSYQQRGITEAIRASVHYYNTREEIDTFISTIKKILS